jgi:Kef-type K+ transport system membrane component KefB
MPNASFTSLAVVLAVAFVSRLVLGLFPRVRVPGVVAEIVLGIVVGPNVLGWAHADEPVKLLATVGLAFLLFLAGLELDVDHLRGPLLRVAGRGFLVSVALALMAGFSLSAAGLVKNPLLVAVALTATSLGLVIPVLKEADAITTPVGQLVVAGASLGDFGAIIALSLLFSRDTSNSSARFVLLGVFVATVAVIAWSIARAGRSMRISKVLVRLQDTTAQIRVRAAMLLLIGLVVLAEHTGLETILAAFVAGAIVSIIDRDAMKTHPQFHLKLEAVGYGFLIPVFFVTSGIRFDLNALLDHPSVFARVPIFLAVLVVVRGVPALFYRDSVSDRERVAAALLQATSLPFIVTATMIGVEIGAITSANAAALVAAGLVSALIFPAVATSLLTPVSVSARENMSAVVAD